MTLILAVFAVSLLLVFLELLVPSAVLGLAGIGGLAGSIVWAWRTEGWPQGLGMLVLAVLIVPVTVVRGVKRFMLRAQVDSNGAPHLEGVLPGMEGTAVTPLRPTGIAVLKGNRIEVLTRGEPVDPGALLRVVAVEGNRVVVAPVERSVS